MIDFNQKLYFYENYMDLILSLYEKKNFPNSIIISGDRGVGKITFIFHFLNKIFSRKKRRSYLNSNEMLDDNLSNIKFIKKNEFNQINIDNIRDIISFCQKQSFYNSERFIIIRNIENLNINASNALLKILEKPPKNVFFILIKDMNTDVNNTILSRCAKIRINFSINESEIIYQYLLNDFNLSNVNNNIFHISETAGNKINKILFLREHNISQYNLEGIILFCLQNFEKTKDLKSLNFAFEFTKNFIFTKLKLNFYKYNKIYKYIRDTLSDSINYNTDYKYSLSLITKILK